jgi:Cdc6-like AAA superfamily ATPase
MPKVIFKKTKTVVGISNTIDLPERLLPRVASRLGKQSVAFKAYTSRDLIEILKSRCGLWWRMIFFGFEYYF